VRAGQQSIEPSRELTRLLRKQKELFHGVTRVTLDLRPNAVTQDPDTKEPPTQLKDLNNLRQTMIAQLGRAARASPNPRQ
jgi:hypothetical protein